MRFDSWRLFDMNAYIWRERADYPQRHADTIFVFGRGQGDYERGDGDTGLLELAADLYKKKLTSAVSIPAAEGTFTPAGERVRTAYPGRTIWARQLEALGVPAGKVIYGPDPGRGLQHTRTEADEFVRLAQQRRWRTAYVVTNPHQWLRAMLSVLVSFRVVPYALRVLPVVPRGTNFDRLVYGPQGADARPRWQWISEELRRIYAYQDQGHLASFDELLEYLQQQE